MMIARLFSLSLICVAAFAGFQPAHAGNQEGSKDGQTEWTVLVFLNGNNNLDSFGKEDINEMEKVGSTDQVNVVVQWASMAASTTKRLYVTQDSSEDVKSLVVEDLPRVDMGDVKNLVEFIRWGAEHYPAKKYLIDIWNHGAGWHRLLKSDGVGIQDISFDDHSGNNITTEELGTAMAEAAKILGQKVDIYGSDACLMNMAEVAAEMSDSVDVMVGSEEVEPGDGWEYSMFLQPLAEKPTMTAKELAKVMVDQYIVSYSGGLQGTSDATQSAFDLTQMGTLQTAVAGLKASLLKLSEADRKKAKAAVTDATNFFYSDYVDLYDFIVKLESAGISALADDRALADVKAAVTKFVVANGVTKAYKDAKGVSIWLPAYSWNFGSHGERYAKLKFALATGWGDVAKFISK
jgi:hypothetical protein